MSNQIEMLEGYVVDLACIRKYPQNELLERAQTHSRECGLSGHCIESGYGLVNEEGYLKLLDPKATLPVLDAIRNSARDRGIKLQVKREMKQGEMETTSVQDV